MFESFKRYLILLPLIGLIVKQISCSNQVFNKPVLLVPLMRYNGDKSTNFQFDSLNGLNEAIESAVNLILEYEKEHDRKLAPQNGGEANYAGGNGNSQVDYKDYKEGRPVSSMSSSPHFDQNEVYQPRPFHDGLKVDQPMYEVQNNENPMSNSPNYNQNYQQQNYGQNNQNYNQNYGQNYNQGGSQLDASRNGDSAEKQPGSGHQYAGNQMASPYGQNNNQLGQMDLMSNGYQANVNHYPQTAGRPVLERNQRYIKKLYCKTKKNTRANKQKLKARNYASASSQYDDFMTIKNPYEYIPFAGFFHTFNEVNSQGGYKALRDDYRAPAAQVIRYPVYVSEYDTDLINRLYSIRNAFI